jgi:hypothetical protein
MALVEIRSGSAPDLLDKHIAAIKDIAGLLLSPTIALASAVMGFYYATQGE